MKEEVMKAIGIKVKCPFIRKCLKEVTLDYYRRVCCTILHTSCPEYRERTKGEKTPAEWEDEIG